MTSHEPPLPVFSSYLPLFKLNWKRSYRKIMHNIIRFFLQGDNWLKPLEHSTDRLYLNLKVKANAFSGCSLFYILCYIKIHVPLFPAPDGYFQWCQSLSDARHSKRQWTSEILYCVSCVFLNEEMNTEICWTNTGQNRNFIDNVSNGLYRYSSGRWRLA